MAYNRIGLILCLIGLVFGLAGSAYGKRSQEQSQEDLTKIWVEYSQLGGGPAQPTDTPMSALDISQIPAEKYIDILESLGEVKGGSGVSWLGYGTNLLTTLLPSAAYRKATRTYLQIIKPEVYKTDVAVGGSNIGLAAYNRQLALADPCFASLLHKFYGEIGSLNQLPRRPALADAAGVGDGQSYPPGWLWEKALAMSRGDANLAMQLIGTCGHDDVSQGFFTIDSSQQAQNKIRSDIETINGEIKKYWQKLNGASNRNEKLKIKKYISYYQKYQEVLKNQNGLPQHLKCPSQSSPFFLPKSLGPNADLSADFKSKVQKTFATPRGSSSANTPAKNYHILAAAHVACQMIKKGVSPRTIEPIIAAGAKIYRGTRMCEHAKSSKQKAKAIAKLLKKSSPMGSLQSHAGDLIKKIIAQKEDCTDPRTKKLNEISKQHFPPFVSPTFQDLKPPEREKYDSNEEYKAAYDQYLMAREIALEKHQKLQDEALKEYKKKVEESKKKYMEIVVESQKSMAKEVAEWNLKNLAKCSVAQELTAYLPNSGHLTDEQSSEIFENFLARIDAFNLYSKWYLGGFLGLPCSDVRLKGPENIYDEVNKKNGESCGPHYTAQECKHALDRLATFDIDFKWTENMHRAGAQFAINKCKKEDPKAKKDHPACPKNQTTPPANESAEIEF